MFDLNKPQFLNKVHTDDKKQCIEERVLSEGMRPYLKLGFHKNRIPLIHFQ